MNDTIFIPFENDGSSGGASRPDWITQFTGMCGPLSFPNYFLWISLQNRIWIRSLPRW